jgi:hypothetical protein
MGSGFYRLPRLAAGLALLSALSSCLSLSSRLTSNSGVESGADSALINNGRGYAGLGEDLIFRPYQSPVMNLELCLDHVDFIQAGADLPGGFLRVTLPMAPRKILMSADGGSFGQFDLPPNLYNSAYLYLSNTCGTGNSIQFNNAFGSFSSSDDILLFYLGAARLAPGGHVLFETQTILNGLAAVTDNSGVDNSVGAASEMYSVGTPFLGTAAQIPGTIQAMNYDLGGQLLAYQTNDPCQMGNPYRPSECIGTEVCSEGGYDVTPVGPGGWLTYTVDVASTGSYTLVARMANPGPDAGSMHFEIDGVNVTGSIVIPVTGGPQTWGDVSISGIPISAGRHYLRFVSETDGQNLSTIRTY